MDWLTFTAELIKALAWPAAMLTIILALRKPLAGLIPLLQRLKYKDLELEFGRQVQEVREEVRAELPPSSTAIAPETSALLVKLAELSPRAAVMEAWRQVEDALLQAAKRHSLQLPDRDAQSVPQVMRALQRAELLDPVKSGIFHDLRSLRNNAAHTPEFAIGRDSAIEYAQLVARLVEYLRTL